MKNISKTTLRELKKRYLNILKKCFLANLGIILLSTPSMAEEIVFDEVYENMTKTGTDTRGGAVALSSGDEINSSETTLFDSNTAIATSNFARGGALWMGSNSSASFSDIVHFKNNTAQGNQTAGGGAIWLEGKALLSVNAPSDTTTSRELLFYNNKATSTVSSEGGVIINYGGIVSISVDTIFDSNVAEAMNGSAYGGALNNGGSFTFEKGVHATFINNEAIGKNVHGGAIKNAGELVFQSASFYSNKAITIGNNIYNRGGAINNSGDNGKLVFNGDVVFGGYKINENGEKISLGNIAEARSDSDNNIESSSAYGGALFVVGGTITFNNKNDSGNLVSFINNKAISENKGASGGGIYNYSSSEHISFSTNVLFQDNIADGYTSTSGGAIYNSGGSVVFENTDGNPETPTVPNITYGMTFNGDTLFIGNKAESETGNSYGGAIYNSGYLLLAGENTFGGYLKNTEDGDGNKTEYILDSDGNKISLGNSAKEGGAIYNSGGKKEGDVIAYGMTLGKATFMGNTALSRGGAIYNSGYMNFTDEAVFEGNSVFAEGTYARGGAIFNTGTLNIENVIFKNNIAQGIATYGIGGAIYNNGANAQIVLKNATFLSNKAESLGSTAQGGAVRTTGGKINFEGYTVFGGFTENGTSLGNIAYAKEYTKDDGSVISSDALGGAIHNEAGSILTFDHVDFIGNKTLSDVHVAFGGAIYNYPTAINKIIFNGYANFKDNTAESKMQTGSGGAIWNGTTSIINFNNSFTFTRNKTISKGVETTNDIHNSGTINFNHGLDENNNQLIGSLDGGISNYGTINKTGAGTLILGDGMKNSGGGTFTQSAGLTIAHTEHFLTGTNTITGGELRIHGADTNKLKASVSNGAMLTYLTTKTERQNVALGPNVSVIGANVTFGAYEGVEQAQYTLGSDIASDAGALKVIIQDSNIKMTGDTYAGSYEIGSSNVIEMRDESIEEQSVTFADLDGSGATLGIDIALLKDSEGKTQLTADRLNLTSDGEGYKFAGVSFNTPMDGQALLDEILSGLMVEQDGTITPSIKHTVQVLGGNASFMGRKEATLSTASPYVYEVATAGQDLTVSVDVLKGSALEYLNDTDTDVTLQIAEKGTTDYTVTEDLKTMGCGKKQILGSTSVATESVIDASGKDLFTLDKADTELGIKNLTITGADTAIDNQAGKVTLENVVIKDTVSDTALKNGATLTLKDVSVDKGVVNSGKLTMSGNNALTTLTNSGETTVEGGKLSVTTLGGVGTLTMNGAELDSTNIATNNTIVSNGMSLSNGLTTFEVKSLEVKEGTTLDLNLAMTTADKIKNEGDMIANKDLSVGALEGTGTLTVNNATLNVADKFKTTNKIVSNGMKIGDKVTSEIHFADLEIKDNTTLDIKTLQATANTVTVGENATLGITLKNLDEYGTMKADEIIAKEDSKVNLTLGDNFAGGVFDVFKGTKGSGDLELVHNNVYNVVEVSEGKYSFMAKDTEALQESLGTTDNETVIANALTQGTTSHAVFSRMQSEMLVALQSQNKETVAKAKKALNAVGSTDQSAVQSVTTEHIGAIFNVVKSEMPSAIGGIGRSGGEEETRAKVYIKGLYDQTKSTMREGFKARSKGAVLGVQSQISEDLTVGVGYAFSNTIAKEDLRRTEADTNTAFASVHYQPNAWWMSGLATYSRANYDEKKEILSTTGTANYNLDSWGIQVMTGYDVKLDRSVITPEVGIRYLSLKQEGYTDTLGTTVEGTKADYVTAMIGVHGMLNLGAIRPTAGFSIGYDVVTDDISAVNTLANGASYTVNSEKLDKLSTIVTLGFKADISKNTSFSLEYSGTFRKEYQDHSGMLRFNYSF